MELLPEKVKCETLYFWHLFVEIGFVIHFLVVQCHVSFDFVGKGYFMVTIVLLINVLRKFEHFGTSGFDKNGFHLRIIGDIGFVKGT